MMRKNIDILHWRFGIIPYNVRYTSLIFFFFLVNKTQGLQGQDHEVYDPHFFVAHNLAYPSERGVSGDVGVWCRLVAKIFNCQVPCLHILALINKR